VNRCEDLRWLREFLDAVIEKLDLIAASGESEMLFKCIGLAEFCNGCSGDKQGRAPLILAELLMVSPPEADGIRRAEKLLAAAAETLPSGDRQLARCTARLLLAKGDYPGAARLWAGICDSLRPRERAGPRSWAWWRAKFFELYCCQMAEGFPPRRLFHTIEVLEKTVSDPPRFWSEKISAIKDRCAEEDR
jgi:hypothetical protein